MTRPRELRPVSPWRIAAARRGELLRAVLRRVREDRITDQSAKLSFYLLLSAFPFLFFLTSLLGVVLRQASGARAMLDELLAAVIPPSAWGLVDATLEEIMRGSGGLGLSLAVVVTIWTASRGMVALVEGLNVAYEVRTYRRWWRRNLLAIGLTIALAAYLALALPLLVLGGRIADWAAQALGHGAAVALAWSWLERIIGLALALLAFDTLYILAPNVANRRWHWLMPGTVVGVGLWLLASYGFALYLRFFDRYSVTYGSIGAVVVLMLWFFLSGIAFLVGGEVNSEIEKAARRGEAPQPLEDS